MDTAINVLIFLFMVCWEIGKFVFNCIKSCFKLWVILLLVGAGPVGWIILYLWDKEIKEKKNAHVCPLS